MENPERELYTSVWETASPTEEQDEGEEDYSSRLPSNQMGNWKNKYIYSVYKSPIRNKCNLMTFNT